jgi:beta-fructofuranosidase
MWECPDFFALGDRHVLIISAYDEKHTFTPGALYFTGRYRDGRFEPDVLRRLDFGADRFYAPQSFTDEQGRRIQFGWLPEDRSEASQRAAGWAGVMSLPRLLRMRSDGLLAIAPVPELEALRTRQREVADILVDEEQVLLHEAGGVLEIEAEFELDPAQPANTFGLLLRRSPDGDEQTLLRYDVAAGALILDRSRASTDATVGARTLQGPLALDGGRVLRLRVFLDQSVIEVFANDSFCLTARVYPTRHDSAGLGVFAQGGRARLKRLRAWDMADIFTGPA